MPSHLCATSAARGAQSCSKALQFQLLHRGLRTQRRYLRCSTVHHEGATSEPANVQSRPQPESASRTQPGRTTALPRLPDDATTLQKFAAKLRARQPERTDTYATFGTTETVFKTCAAAGDYSATTPTEAAAPKPDTKRAASPTPVEVLASGTAKKTAPSGPPVLKTPSGEEIYFPASLSTWHSAYSLPPSFVTWSHVTILHLYLVLVRARQFPSNQGAKSWEQNMLNHFFFAAEERMETLHGLTSKSLRTRYLKDLFNQYRGSIVSYDEGLLKGDAVLAAAVWRNLFGGRDDVDAVALAEIVGWIRRSAKGLAGLSDEVFAAARWHFGEPWAGRQVVEQQSLGMAAGFGDEAAPDGKPVLVKAA